MDLDSTLTSILNQPDLFILPGNHSYAKDFVAAGGRVQPQSSGHLVFYGTTGRRILLTDPEGHPLHEVEWTHDDRGNDQLVSARVQLDWAQWVGIKPGHLTYETHLNLSARPGWESITKDDLRMMAARAMNVSLEHIQFFYRDDDIVIDRSGQATIRQKKDAFFILQDGRFDHATFMSCMTAMHWERIDYLPVVELFLSLLPGTGSATFELIRGLYDDQNPNQPLSLHYRGIPPYPSEGAFRLFSQFFTPSADGGVDPLRLFLDETLSDKVTWLPSLHTPLRYFDTDNQMGVTISQGRVVKATLATDSAGLPFLSPKPRGLPVCGRSVVATERDLILQDHAQALELPSHETWRISHFSDSPASLESIPTWRSLFPNGAPHVNATQAYSAVLLYPEDQQVIGEAESQPFLFDYVDDFVEEQPEVKRSVLSARRNLVVGCDAALNVCVRLEAARTSTVLYRLDHLAQKQAQALWNLCARTQKWEHLQRIQFLPEHDHVSTMLQQTYDLIYYWVPFEHFSQPEQLELMVRRLSNALNPGGLVILSGVSVLEGIVRQHRLHVLSAEFVHNLPTFRLHQAILPKARLQQDLMVFVLKK